MFHDVVENKWRKNVRFKPLHDVIENERLMLLTPRCDRKDGQLQNY
jgi:hypothetical protein